MKILVVGETNWFGRMTENSAEALIELGHDVEVFSSYEASKDIISRIWGRLETKIPAIREKRRCRQITLKNALLIDRLKKHRFDMILFLKGNDIFPETLIAVKENMSGPLAVWFFDDPFPGMETGDVLNSDVKTGLEYYDFKFCFDSYYVPLLNRVGTKNSYFLPLAFNPEDYRQIHLKGPERELYGSDISFVGSYCREREEYIKQLTEFELKLWGGWWHCPELRRCSVEKIVSSEAAAKIYSAGSINLNIHHPQSIKGCNCRTFEINGSGGFQLVDRKKDMLSLFEIGKELVCFETADELRELVKYYLAHPDEREAIAEQGYQRAIKEHTFKNRMQSMLKKLEE